jgi:hypothetical protein
MNRKDATVLDRSPKDSEMTDVALAQSLVQETWPERAGRPVKTCIAMIFDAVKRVERKLPDEVRRQRQRPWTERRVRSIWNAEARRIDNYEMADLERAAAEEAKSEFNASIRRAARMASFLAAQDADFHGPEIDRLRQFLGHVDRA